MQNLKTQFVLKGFSEVSGFRVFEFEGISADWTRTSFTVRTDLALTRRYGIRLQELPLLCRAVLERRREGAEQRAYVYSDEDMRLYAKCEAAQAEVARRKKRPRTHVTGNTGTAWRVPSL